MCIYIYMYNLHIDLDRTIDIDRCIERDTAIDIDKSRDRYI